jgi:quinol-cytochrome oxidoreductase complex cytochrome b subunit
MINAQNMSTWEKFKAVVLDEDLPEHMKIWWWCLGGVPAVLLLILIITGILLAMNYSPTISGAYESVNYITNNIRYGWWLRAIHKWSAELMVVTVSLHVIRVFFTRAYTKPREYVWMSGVLLLLMTLFAGFTGYSLLYTQKSYWAVTAGTNLAGKIAIVGPFLQKLLIAGDSFNKFTLSRFLILHGAVVPAVIGGIIFIHIILLRKVGVSELNGGGKTYKFYPDHIMTEVIIGLMLLFFMTVLAIVFPLEPGVKANPLVTPLHIKPEWYFYPMFKWIKLTSQWIGLYVPVLVIALFFFWPYVDKWLVKTFKMESLPTWIGLAGMIFITILMILESA